MSSIVAASPCSRPKIHRLPVRSSRFSTKRLLGWLAVVALFSGLSLLAQKEVSDFSAAESMQAGRMPEATVSVAAAQSAPVATPLARQQKTIMLKGKSEFIVGQLAKIPTESEQITEIKPLSDIDNHAGHELLSIISKY
ncbi:MAG: hypothetical protein KGJ06_03010 [Pseudomonadota bacterium]|nr:hypothetical protein [Pseudomonadota bacterium]